MEQIATTRAESLATIRALRPTMTGIMLTLGCPQCSAELEVHHPTIAGICLGRHVCPGCFGSMEVSPESFQQALDEFLPEPSRETMIQLTEEATRITESWHQHGAFRAGLMHQGVNLGEAGERFLGAPVTLGLMLSDSARRTNA